MKWEEGSVLTARARGSSDAPLPRLFSASRSGLGVSPPETTRDGNQEDSDFTASLGELVVCHFPPAGSL